MTTSIFRNALVFLLVSISAAGQSFTSYFTGNTADKETIPAGGICLMGGATESDEAMKWFLDRSGHGDVVVLRASGADGYNNYLFKDLGMEVNSVETIVFNQADASNEPYIHRKINQAEAIWIAGGDQWDYVSYWRHTAIDSLINVAVAKRHVVIGGTSAGMAIMGGFYYSAMHESETSAEALADPYNSNMSVDSAGFIHNEFLQHVITDTHYDGRDRMGRHVTFMARIFTDWGIEPKGIACEEYAAVCIDTTGLARCYGGGPQKQDFTYFLQPNCELTDREPESCKAGIPLDWNRGNKAIKVYKINGTAAGENTFDLKDWVTGTGGAWENWYVDHGTLVKQSGNPMNCSVFSAVSPDLTRMRLYPNPATGGFIQLDSQDIGITQISILDISGRTVKIIPAKTRKSDKIDLTGFGKGVYLLVLKTENDSKHFKIILQ